MSSNGQTREQLAEEVALLRQHVAELEDRVADLKHTEQALRTSEEHVRLFVEHTPAAVAMLDRELRYIMTSRRWMIDYELGDQNIIGRSHYEIFPDIPDKWKAVHQRCLAGAIEQQDEDP